MDVAEPRTVFIATMLLLPAAAVVNAIVHGLQLNSFLKRTPTFATYQNIVDFEKIVARQMYAALLQIVLLVTPGILFVIGLVRLVLAVDDFIYVMLPALAILAFGAAFKMLENRARSIPVDDPVLEERRNYIVEVWNSKALPNW
jgi:hypothetical protein